MQTFLFRMQKQKLKRSESAYLNFDASVKRVMEYDFKGLTFTANIK